MAKQTKAALEADELDVVADRGTFNSEEILACEAAGITVTLQAAHHGQGAPEITRWEHTAVLSDGLATLERRLVMASTARRRRANDLLRRSSPLECLLARS